MNPVGSSATFKILIIEDDEDTANIIAADFEDHGLTVEMVHDGSKAISKMLEFRPHLVVLDLELPNKNGHEIFQEMRLHKELRDLPVVGNSVHMSSKDDLGSQFYNAYILSRQEEPLFANKLEANERMFNNLTALVAFALSQKYQMLTPSLAKYLDEMSVKEKRFKSSDTKSSS
ncbi:MAG: Regulator of RpoS [Elusimicrobia bacterium]|nr:Regulator of RpoS [Elusimicrobiota bacterium]